MQRVMGTGVQNRHIMIRKDSPLVADMGTPADGCDIGF